MNNYKFISIEYKPYNLSHFWEASIQMEKFHAGIDTILPLH